MDSDAHCVLDLQDVLPLVGTHTRPLVEGSAVLKTGILSVGKVDSGDDFLEVFALVVQCSHTDELPHGVNVRITVKENGEKKVKPECTCIAGKSGSCKHCIAVALRLTRLRVSDLESTSCTDMKQKWGKPQMKALTRSQFAGVPLAKQCHFQPRGAEPAVVLTKEQRDGLLQEFLNISDPDSELPLFMSLRRFEEKNNDTLPVHKSISRALQTVATASTALPKPKPQTIHQLKALREAQEQEAQRNKEELCEVRRKTSTGLNVSQLNDLPQNETAGLVTQEQEAKRNKEELCEVRRMISSAIDTGLNVSQLNDLPQNETAVLVRKEIAEITALLQNILPAVDSGTLEGDGNDSNLGAPLAQSTPKEHSPLSASTTAETTPKRVPLKDKTNTITQRNLSKTNTIINRSLSKKPADENTSGGADGKKMARKLKLEALKTQHKKNCMTRGTRIPSFNTAPKEWISSKLSKDILHRLDLCPPIFSNVEDSIVYKNRISISEEEAVSLCIETVGQSDCPQWQARRQMVFTGSNAYELYRRKLDLTENAEWEKFLRGRIRQRQSGKESKGNMWTMERGLGDEPFAKEKYQLQTGKKVHNLGACIHPQIPHLLSSPDGVVIEDDIYVEVKSPELGIQSTASDIVFQLPYIANDKGTAKLREKDIYYGQVQMAMAILSLKQTHLVIYASFDHSIYIVPVDFNADFVKKYFTRLSDIYFRHNFKLLRELAIV